MRRAADDAAAHAKAAAKELADLYRQHSQAALEHTRAQAAAQQRAAQVEAELSAKSEALEQAQAARRELEAAVQALKLRNEMMETKLRVLTECYRQLESEQAPVLYPASVAAMPALPPALLPGRGADHLPLRPLWPNADLAPGCAPAGACCTHSRAGRAASAPDPADLDPHLTPPSAGRGWSTEALTALPPTHLGLALACAELHCRLDGQTREAEAAQLRANVAQEQAAALKLLLARQQGAAAAGDIGPLLARLEAAEAQLGQARAIGAELRQKLDAKEREAQAALRDKARLQQDLQLMLGARDALAALKASLQKAASA